MTDGETQPDPPPPSRRPIILIGAPSGAGKTVLSQRIIAGALPEFAKLFRRTPNEPPIRYDLKVLPDDPPRDRTLIIECSTYKFERLMGSSTWRRMAALIRESEIVIHVCLDVPKLTVVRQYFLRIFTEPKRMNVFYRILQVSKYRTTIIYLLTGQLARSSAAWDRFGRRLAKEMPSRVAVVRAVRNGTEFRLLLEQGARAHISQ